MVRTHGKSKFLLFVEGGGDCSDLQADCREGFRVFLEKAGLKGCMPRIIACGGRQEAFNDFRYALKNEVNAYLLLDAENLVDPKNIDKPWEHLAEHKSDGIHRPDGAKDECCHLMATCMESWFLADHNTLESFYKQGFQKNLLPSPQRKIESIAKDEVLSSLEKATKNSKTKGKYDKGSHSFLILRDINPTLVRAACHWANRFLTELSKVKVKAI